MKKIWRRSKANFGLRKANRSDIHNEIPTRLQKNAEIARKPGHKLDETKAYLKSGYRHRSNGNIETAIQHYQTAVEIASEHGYKEEETQAHLVLGDGYRLNSKKETALEHYQKALEIATEQGYKKEETQACLVLGYCYASNKNNETAIQYYRKALEIAREQEYKNDETKAYLVLGDSYRVNNKNKPAFQQYHKALEIAREQGYKIEETQAYLGLGHCSASNNKNETAIWHYKKALDIAREHEYQKEEIKALHGLGKAYRSINKNESAIQQYQKALEIAKKHEYPKEETKALLGLGKAYRSINKNESAIQQYQKALEIARERGYKKEETLASLALGECYRLNNENETAIQHYQKTLEIARERGYKNVTESGYSDSRDNICGATVNVSDTAQLQDIQNETANNVDCLNPNNESYIDSEIASKGQLLLEHSYADVKKNEDAIKTTAPIVDVTHRNDSKAKYYQGIGNAATGNRKHHKAIEYYEKAHKISPDLKVEEIEVTAYQWLGYNQLQAGDYQESIKYYSDALKLATQIGDKKKILNAYLGLGCAFINNGEAESSRKCYLKALITTAELSDKKRLDGEVHTNLGHVYYNSCMFDAALKSYLNAQEIFNDLGESQHEANAYLMLGHTFRKLKQHEKAIEFYEKALSMNNEVKDKELQRSRFEKSLVGIINEWCGYCCRFIDGKNKEAISFYEKAKEIAKQDGAKYQEYRANQAVGEIFYNTGNLEKAKHYHQEALRNAMEIDDKHCEGTSYLGLASASSKEFDYEMARKWYEKALHIFETEHNDKILKEKALVGLGIAWFDLGKPQKATETIRKARQFAKDETEAI